MVPKHEKNIFKSIYRVSKLVVSEIGECLGGLRSCVACMNLNPPR